MSTSEGGGATTQAGVYFQNCIAALRFAHMLSGDERPPLGRIGSVRVEAPEHVDDVVVNYSGGREYIQAKLAVAVGSPAWVKLWEHFYEQYRLAGQGNGREQITLAIRWTSQTNDLEGLLERAASSESAAEWDTRLNEPQRRLLKSIAGALGVDEPALFDFCRSVKVWQLRFEGDPTGSDTFEDEVRRVLRGTVEPLEAVFPVLLNMASEAARRRAALGRDDVVADLKRRGFRIPPVAGEDLTSFQRKILEQELAGLSPVAELLNRKVARLRRASIVEASEAVKFQLEHEIEEAETELGGLTARIGAIEQKLR